MVSNEVVVMLLKPKVPTYSKILKRCQGPLLNKQKVLKIIQKCPKNCKMIINYLFKEKKYIGEFGSCPPPSRRLLKHLTNKNLTQLKP